VCLSRFILLYRQWERNFRKGKSDCQPFLTVPRFGKEDGVRNGGTDVRVLGIESNRVTETGLSWVAPESETPGGRHPMIADRRLALRCYPKHSDSTPKTPRCNSKRVRARTYIRTCAIGCNGIVKVRVWGHADVDTVCVKEIERERERAGGDGVYTDSRQRTYSKKNGS